jgi:hypothetical protein
MAAPWQAPWREALVGFSVKETDLQAFIAKSATSP